MTAGLNHGFRRGYITTIGLVAGIMTQLLVVSIGLGALVATSNTAFQVIKWVGVVYLVWLGVQQWRAPARPMVSAQAGDALGSAVTMMVKGWMINAANPKGTVFMLAVVPQFLDLARPLTPQYLIIGATMAFTDLVVMAGYTALAARVLSALKSPSHVRATNRIFGALFVLAGATLSIFKRGV